MQPTGHISRSLAVILSLIACADSAWPAEQAASSAQGPVPAAGGLAEAGAAMKPAEKLPVETFAQLPFVERARISPDGTHMAGLFGIKGTQGIVVINLLDRSEKIQRMGVPDQTEVRWLRWVNNDNLLIGLTALRKVQGDDWYVSRAIGFNRITGKVTQLLWNVGGQNASDVVWCPGDSGNEVLIAAQDSIFVNEAEFWPSVYRVDITTGRDRVDVRARVGVMDWAADGGGTVRLGIGYDDSARTSRLLYRAGGGITSFRTVDRANERKRQFLRVPFMFIPGGEHALVIGDDDKGMSSIFEFDLATQAVVRAVFVPESGEVEDAVISRDGATLLGVTTSALKGGVHWFDARLAELQAHLDRAIPNSTASIESMSDDRTRMLVRTASADAPGSINLFTANDGGLHRLAYINELIGSQHLAPVKVVNYKARDGLAIEALLTLPVGREPANLPLVVMPHGGPWAQDTLDYDYWQQFLANRGCAVLQPNFRGSTGYGTDFLRKGEGQLGLAMQDDLTDGVRWAIAHGVVDPARVCIVGASYGGYAAMWGIAKDPDLYRCAVSIAGVASLRREVYDFGNDIHAGRYTDDWKRMTPDFDAVSPINATERIKTPLLLIHGQKDVTVSSAQSSKMFNRMKRSGKDVDLLLLPLADHYYTRQDDRVALLSAIEKFLTKYNPAE